MKIPSILNSFIPFRSFFKTRPDSINRKHTWLPVWIIVFTLVLGMASAGTLLAVEDYEDVYSRAEQNFRSGKYDDALQLYKKANKLRNDASIECLWGIVQAYNRLGAHKNVIETGDQMIKAAGGDPEYLVKAWTMRGNSYSLLAMANPKKRDAQKLAEAELSFRKVMELSPQSITPHYNLGLILMWMGRKDEGLAELRAFVNSGEEGPSVDKARKIIENPERAAENFAPNFSMVTSDGEYLSLDDFNGKVILLDFWGTWCPPCRNAIPYLSRLNRKYARNAFVLISIDVHDAEDVWREYINGNNMNWVHVRDADNKIQQIFQVNAFPTYILVDNEGVIVGRKVGGGLISESDVENAVKKALKK